MEIPEINHENVKTALENCLILFDGLNPLERIRVFQDLRGCLQSTHGSTIQGINEDMERANGYRNTLNAFNFDEQAVKA